MTGLDVSRLYDHWPAVLGYCRKRVNGNDALAEDIAAATLERALRSADAYQETGVGPGPWLCRIARNLLIDWQRKHANRYEVVLLDVVDYHRAQADVGTDAHADMLDVRAALDTLAPRRRALLVDIHVNGRSGVEIAAERGVHRQAIYRRQRTALRTLRAVLTGEGVTA